jgi:hypothetical protein
MYGPFFQSPWMYCISQQDREGIFIQIYMLEYVVNAHSGVFFRRATVLFTFTVYMYTILYIHKNVSLFPTSWGRILLYLTFTCLV